MIISRVLAGAFGAGVQFRNQLYDRGKLKIEELQGPVVSIGNISVGGTGKTPFVIHLGELLKSRGIAFDILSRGYRRSTKGALVVDPAGSPQQFGDEPLLLSLRLGVPVIVGESRYQAGLLAERQWGPRLHLLDDGFQHRSLVRQFDIVLLSPGDLHDVLLPAGRLREPLSSLFRADAVVFAEHSAESKQDLPVDNIWEVKRTLQLREHPKNPVAFCAIGRPRNFFLQLRLNGLNLAGEVTFRDHHRYTPGDVGRLHDLAQAKDADGFVTTAKDAINLGSLADQLSGLSIAELEMTLDNANHVLDTIIATLAERGKPIA